MRAGRRTGLVPRLLAAIILGIVLGVYAPEWLNRVLVTAGALFSAFLRFIIPIMILAFVTKGIADLTRGAGRLLLATAVIAYLSTLAAGTAAYLTAVTVFPEFITETVMDAVAQAGDGALTPYFTVPLEPLMDVTAAVVLAFILGVCLSSMRGSRSGDILYGGIHELSDIVNVVLARIIIPLLPLYICATFISMTVSGQTFTILGVLWKVFFTVVILHLAYLLVAFMAGGAIAGRNPLTLMKNQIPGYLTALGTQSSAATIPVNLRCAEADGVCEQVRNFVIPLCANIHMAGSMITITCCVTSVLLLYDMPLHLGIIVPFIMTLGVAMIAAPGAPGGAIMSALPFLPMVGIDADGAVASLLIALYITQDSFGTACNVSGDNAIAVVIDKIYRRYICRQ